ncbi:MAG: AIR synthase related protein [Promethearchaeota archaeon]
MLEKIAESIKNNKNILEKKEINPIVEYIDSNSYKSSRIYSSIGEDSASIINENDKLTLITTDRIKTEFIENFPFGAGFSSILVGVDDIYACGGTPLAATIIVSFKEQNIGMKIIEGICAGSNKFKIPIIRGHTNTRDYYELSSTLIGEIKKEDYISATNAKIGDYIILAVDFDGKVGKASNLYWDTTTFKDTDTIIKKRESMNEIAKRHLANASKDISNGGIFGTILQLIKYSKVGAKVNINQIEIPPLLKKLNYDLKTYIKMYLTTSFIITSPEENCHKIINIFKKHGMTAKVMV